MRRQNTGQGHARALAVLAPVCLSLLVPALAGCEFASQAGIAAEYECACPGHRSDREWIVFHKDGLEFECRLLDKSTEGTELEVRYEGGYIGEVTGEKLDVALYVKRFKEGDGSWQDGYRGADTRRLYTYYQKVLFADDTDNFTSNDREFVRKKD